MKKINQPGLNAVIDRFAVILAGGRSSRFGSDKAFARIGNKTMVDMVADTLMSTGFELAISTNHQAHEEFGHPLIWDSTPFQGPLYALHDILEKTNHQKILLVACDTPFVTSHLVQQLWNESNGWDITVLCNGRGIPSPLPGVYAQTALSKVKKIIRGSMGSLKSLLGCDLKINVIPANQWQLWDAKQGSLFNINTVDSLRKGYHG